MWFNLTSNDIKVENMSKSNCMQKNVGKYHTRYEIQVFTDSSSSSSSSFETRISAPLNFTCKQVFHPL